MANTSSFNELTLEEKRDYLWRLFSPKIDKLENWRKYLEIFLLWASDEKLNNFYNAMLNWDKEYVSKLISDIKSKKSEVKKLKTEFSFEVMKYKEEKERNITEKNVDEQLENL